MIKNYAERNIISTLNNIKNTECFKMTIKVLLIVKKTVIFVLTNEIVYNKSKKLGHLFLIKSSEIIDLVSKLEIHYKYFFRYSGINYYYPTLCYSYGCKTHQTKSLPLESN